MTEVRYNLLFQIDYSIRLEKMAACLMGRCDRGVSFLQLVIGASIPLHTYPVLAAFALILLSSWALIWQPAVLAVKASTQKQRYEELLMRAASLSDEALMTASYGLQSNDSSVLGALCRVAHVGVEIARGIHPQYALSRYEKYIAWFSGDLPVEPQRVTEPPLT